MDEKKIKSMLDNIGKVIYCVPGYHVNSFEICGVKIASSDMCYIGTGVCDDEYNFYEEDEGKEWFWTREEAEANLQSKPTDTPSIEVQYFYDDELLRNAIVSQDVFKAMKHERDYGKTVEFRKFEPLVKEEG